MTRLSSIAAVALLAASGALTPASAANRLDRMPTGATLTPSAPVLMAASNARCRYSLDEYNDYAKELALFADKSRARAEQNPIYEADVQYYVAELASARECIQALTPFTSAAR